MTSRFMLIVAAISGFIYVALGAFGAHVLSKTLGVVEMGWIQTGLVGVYHACRRRQFPGGLGAIADWRHSYET